MSVRRLMACALLGCGLLLAACSKKDEPAPPPTAPANVASADLPALLKEARLVAPSRLTICFDIPYAPLEINDKGGGGQLTGFDAELVRAIAAQLGAAACFHI